MTSGRPTAVLGHLGVPHEALLELPGASVLLPPDTPAGLSYHGGGGSRTRVHEGSIKSLYVRRSLRGFDPGGQRSTGP